MSAASTFGSRPSGPEAISVEHIVKRYGSFEAVKDVSFSVAEGEIFGLLGPNGAGKSTLIRMMTTLIPLTGGRAEVAGHDVAKEPDAVRRVIGVIPRFMREREIAYEAADELIATETMRERKEEMEKRADAFIALPGGFGTLEEILEVLTLRQLGRHSKPIAFLDTANFYRPLVAMFEHLYENKFAKPDYRRFYHIAETPADALEYFTNHNAEPPVSK